MMRGGFALGDLRCSHEKVTPLATAPTKQLSPVARYLENRADLLRFFERRTRSAAEADDLVQELYFKVCLLPSTMVVKGNAYFYRLGLNLLFDQFRSASRARRRDLRYVEAHGAVLGTTSISDLPSPAEAAESRIRLEQLLGAVETLGPQCRRVFRMHKFEGLSHNDVAVALGISCSAVEKHMAVAMKRLSAALQ